MELLLLGERQSAGRLLALGLVNCVVPRAELLETALAWAAEIATRNPWSVLRLKRLVTQELQGQLARALELEQATTIEAFGRPEARSAADAFRDRS
jgi:enoyl-CoA hydratase/carnithine racemase